MTSFKWLFFLLPFVGACTESVPEENAQLPRVQLIVDSAMIFHGSNLIEGAQLSFHLRGRDYSIFREGGNYSYTSQHQDSTGIVKRELGNDGYHEYIDRKLVSLAAKDSLAHAETVNSVVYFTLLPVFLNDASVHKSLDGLDTLDGKAYHKVKVTFAEQGGGIDFQDVYLYWFDVVDYSMDYLAYSFTVNDGGSRFRKAVNPRRVNGILFQDFENYRGPSPDSLQHIAALYKADKLERLSTVEISQLKVDRK